MAIASGKNAEFQPEITRIVGSQRWLWDNEDRTQYDTFIPGPWDVVQDFYSSLADAAPPKGPRNDLGIPVDHLNLYEPWPARDRDHSTHSHPQNQASESSTDIWGTSSMSSHSTDSFDVYGSQSFQHGKTPRPRSRPTPMYYLPPTQQPHRHHPRVGPERIPASLRAAEEQARVQAPRHSRNYSVFNNEISPAPKRPTLACLFCRERKIGCMRPSKDNPDQSCNQCVRRKRVCEYPTECRRGQHVRRRRSTKSNTPALISPASPAAVQT
ncbi:hypothetical protein B0H14DRAFT_3463087 [Mycena olivaceomarginata]|nr:hypothetical protein B0H14DRAFT_3463087 [Mycena olivaceomarginata]